MCPRLSLSEPISLFSAIQFWTPCSQGKQELLTITVLCMIYGGHMCTYPQMVPRKRFIMKKAPTKISETKYSHGQVLPTASFT